MGTMIWIMVLSQFLPPRLPWGDCIIEQNSAQWSICDQIDNRALERTMAMAEKLIAERANRAANGKKDEGKTVIVAMAEKLIAERANRAANGKKDESKTVIVTNVQFLSVGKCTVYFQEGNFTNHRLMLRFMVLRRPASQAQDPRSWLNGPNAARLTDDEGHPWKIDRKTSLNESLFESGKVDFLEIWAEAPNSTSHSVILTLPAPEFGQTGEFRFRLKEG